MEGKDIKNVISYANANASVASNATIVAFVTIIDYRSHSSHSRIF